MKKCSACVSPESWDTIELGADGICNICNQHAVKRQINWVDRRRRLDHIVAEAKARGDTYDCIIPASGAKDSTFQMLYAVRDLGLKPLIVRFDHGLYRPKVEENFRRTVKLLGVDVATFGASFHTVREIMLEGLKRRGDACLFCHLGIYGNVMQQAVRFKIPLLFWGEQISEYQAWGEDFSFEEIEQVDEKRFNRMASLNMTAEDLFGMLGGRVSQRDLAPFAYPSTRELKQLGLKSLCLGSFIPWDVKANTERIKRELGWEGDYVENMPAAFSYEKVECQLQGVRDWLRWIKRGHSRATHLANIEIRAGRMTRDEGLALEAANIPRRPASLDHFLNMWQITEDEFMEMAIASAPMQHKHFHTDNEFAAAPADIVQWDRTEVPWPAHPGASLNHPADASVPSLPRP